jgi:hypothetical protein
MGSGINFGFPKKLLPDHRKFTEGNSFSQVPLPLIELSPEPLNLFTQAIYFTLPFQTALAQIDTIITRWLMYRIGAMGKIS